MSRQRPERSAGRRNSKAEAALERAARTAAAEAAVAIADAAQRFETVAAADAADGGRAGDAATLRRLRQETIAGMGRVAYSSNAVFLLEMGRPDPFDADRPLRAIYKPARGERPLWDFPRHTLHLREVACYLVSAALGDGLVPPTTLRDGPHGPGSVQLFVHAAPTSGAVPDDLAGQVADMAALDVLINNADRKSAHLVFGDDGRLRGIDNALSFLPYPRQRTVLIDFGGRPLPAATAARVIGLAADADGRARLSAQLRSLLAEEEVKAFGERLDALAEDRRYPELDPWDGRPFEWW